MALFNTFKFGREKFGKAIVAFNKKSVLEPYRKVEIKRRLADGTGDYETDWHDITNYIKEFGTVSWNLDTETIGVFIQSSMTLIGDNMDKAWDTETESESLFAGYLTRYKTLFRVTIGLYISPSVAKTGSVFYGILTDNITLTETDAILHINSLTQVFREQSTAGMSFTGTASNIVNIILSSTDNSGNNLFDRFIEGDSIASTTLTYTDVVAPTEQSCWDAISRLCMCEDFCAYVGNDGIFYFKGKTSETDITWNFNGPGIYDEVYGVNIEDIQQSNNIWTKVKNKVAVEHISGSYGTAGDTWSKGDASSSDKYGEQLLSFEELWLNASEANSVAGSLYNTYKDPKKEVVLTSTTFNPELKLLDRVKVNYYGENSVEPASLWGISVFDDAYSLSVGLWTGKKGGIYLNNESMNIIGIDLDLDNCISTFTLREV